MGRKVQFISIFLVMAISALSCSTSDLGDVGNIDFGDIDLGAIGDVENIRLPDLGQISPSKQIEGSGIVVEEARNLNNVNNITLKSMGDLNVTLGEKEGLVIQAEDNLIQYFQVEVVDQKLVIAIQEGTQLLPTQPVNFILSLRSLDALTLSSSGNIITGEIDAQDFTITLDGSGNIKIPGLSAQSLKVRLPGSGNISVDGVVTDQNIVISGSGNYNAAKLESEKATAKISGSGSVKVNVLTNLKATISGSGVVAYSGDPEVKQDVSGSGEVVRLEE